MAVLATYVNDQFLAMYHCVRSSAVKEPFPDAWDNLILLFERVRYILRCILLFTNIVAFANVNNVILQNRSSLLPSLSVDVQFSFLRPSEKSCLEIKSQTKDDHKSSETDLFSLLIRTLGFFFIKSRYFNRSKFL